MIEVLQAIPGRPIGGERTVRLDGTISLGFYGDLAVAGLTRDEIKVRVVEHLRKYLSDEQLGLAVVDPQSLQPKAVPPLQSDRVFVADEVDFVRSAATPPSPDGKVQVGQILAIEVLRAIPGRPISGERVVRPDGTVGLGFYGDLAVEGLTRNQIKVRVIELLRAKLSDEVLGLIKEDAQGQQQTIAPVDSACVFVDDATTREEPKAANRVQRLTGQVAELAGKLEAALDAIEQLRIDRNDAKGGPAGATSPRTH